MSGNPSVTTPGIYDQHLDKNPANHVALSPMSYVERTAEVFGT
jgi:fatty-acyl-CoA synthase